MYADVAELFRAPVPSPLWHYTTKNGAIGIIDSKSIWATDSTCLNDPTEISHALHVVREVLPTIQIHSSSEYAREAVEQTIEDEFSSGLLSKDMAQMFIASFSASSDNLGQWRAYSEMGRGVSIGFDCTRLRPDENLQSLVTFAPCIYDQTEKAHLIRSLIQTFFAAETSIRAELTERKSLGARLRGWRMVQTVFGLPADLDGFRLGVQNDVKTRVEKAFNEFRYNLIRLSYLFKHPAYSYEAEWRLVLPHLRKNKKLGSPILDRGTSTPVPYIAFELSNFGGGAINEMVLGPCADFTAADLGVGPGIEVKNSKIPFRN